MKRAFSTEGTGEMREGPADRGPPFREIPPALWRCARAADLGDAPAWIAWELSRCVPALEGSRQFAFGALVVALWAVARDGSTHLVLERDALEDACQSLGLVGDSRAHVLALGLELRVWGLGGTPLSSLVPVVGVGGAHAPLLLDGARLYMHRMYISETRLARAIASRLGAPSGFAPAEISRAIEDVEARPTFGQGGALELAASQLEALAAALASRATIISGGPGTGKTSVVLALVRAFVRLGVAPGEIALCAPTGRAAYRMREALAGGLAAVREPAAADLELAAEPPNAATLHRTLGVLPHTGEVRLHAGNPIAARVVIVDECSMLDVVLMDHLLGALRAETQLVLLGDADQLPSVDAGAVLRDLGQRSAVRLRESHRMRADDPAGRKILLAAAAILAGDSRAFAPAASGQKELFAPEREPAIVARTDPRALRLEGVELLDASPDQHSARESFLRRWWDERVGPALHLLRGRSVRHARLVGVAQPMPFEGEDLAAIVGALKAHASARILCALRGGLPFGGAAWINEHLHRFALRAAGAGPKVERDAARFVEGEPIVVLSNDDARGLFNGDLGVVVRAHHEQEGASSADRFAVFSRGAELRVFSLAGLEGNVALAYATTVHKSQGSEADGVAIFLPDEGHPLVTRELLYTALTRARRSAVVVGSFGAFARGIERKLHRATALSERIEEALAPGRDGSSGERSGDR
jgi:exodeoxyribonuclease V alpha subunit